MNRYQLEVAEMDRRHRLMVRAVTFSGAAVLMVAALWSADLPPSVWIERATAWFASLGGEQEVAQAQTAPAAPPMPAASTTVAQPTAEILAGTDSSISPTPQPLYLVATSPGRNKNEGTARIGVNPDNPQTYVGGAVLANGARLAEIHREYVVLARGASTAKLPLYRRNAPSPPPRDALLMVGGEPPSAPAPTMQHVLTEYLRPSPVYQGETLRGYEVYPGRKAWVFARLGLQAGDVITAIDGLPLSEPQQAMELFEQLTRGVAVTATIERKNQVQSIALDGALIISDQEAARNSAVQTPPPFDPAPG